MPSLGKEGVLLFQICLREDSIETFEPVAICLGEYEVVTIDPTARNHRLGNTVHATVEFVEERSAARCCMWAVQDREMR